MECKDAEAHLEVPQVCCSKSSTETLSIATDFSDSIVVDGQNSNDYESMVQEKLNSLKHSGE